MLSPEAWTALAAWVTAVATIVLVWFTVMAVRLQAREQRALQAEETRGGETKQLSVVDGNYVMGLYSAQGTAPPDAGKKP